MQTQISSMTSSFAELHLPPISSTSTLYTKTKCTEPYYAFLIKCSLAL